MSVELHMSFDIRVIDSDNPSNGFESAIQIGESNGIPIKVFFEDRQANLDRDRILKEIQSKLRIGQ